MKSSSSPLWLALLLAAAPARAKLMEDTVAVVNGVPILLSEFQKEAGTAHEFWSRSNPGSMDDPANARKLRESTLEQLIDRELLNQEGQRLKLKVREREIDGAVEEIKARFKRDEAGRELPEAEAEAAFRRQIEAEGLDFVKFRSRLAKQILARKVIDESVKSKVRPPEPEKVRAYFDRVAAYIESKSTAAPPGLGDEEAAAFREVAGQVQALSSERARVQRILVRICPGAGEAEKRRALRDAKLIKEKLDGGADFAATAREESEDPESAARGGDLGYVLRGVAPPELEKASFTQGVGEVSPPIFTELGYHIVRVTERRAAEKPDFERFKDEIAQFLGNASFQSELEAFVKDLRRKAVVETSLPPAP